MLSKHNPLCFAVSALLSAQILFVIAGLLIFFLFVRIGSLSGLLELEYGNKIQCDISPNVSMFSRGRCEAAKEGSALEGI